ncbi:hypothetical protein [Limnohabitans sp. WS1]|uniref:hypothetical protein n=1 Tax=Limnohabitans sp. WS1 TaxID=1100726 RepID=UPI001304AF3D|nr:hypothetical protein [Limnohabitans sp. WS1]
MIDLAMGCAQVGAKANTSTVSLDQFDNERQHEKNCRENADAYSVIASREISDLGDFEFVHHSFPFKRIHYDLDVR